MESWYLQLKQLVYKILRLRNNTERRTMSKIIAMLYSAASLRPVFFSYSILSVINLLRSTWKALKDVAGEGWGRSVRPIL
jgi:hypothetical protein